MNCHKASTRTTDLKANPTALNPTHSEEMSFQIRLEEPYLEAQLRHLLQEEGWEVPHQEVEWDNMIHTASHHREDYSRHRDQWEEEVWLHHRDKRCYFDTIDTRGKSDTSDTKPFSCLIRQYPALGRLQ